MMEITNDLLAGWDIVVIDDEEDSLEVANIILTEYGANVHTAYNGKNGLDMVRSVRPRFVISDLSMPLLDGWGFIYQMKQDPATRDIPVIALTAHAMNGDRERALSAGFHNYLAKPLTVDTFMNDLLKLLVDIPSFADELGL